MIISTDLLLTRFGNVFPYSDRATKQILTKSAKFHRLEMPDATITSPHSILGSGGLSDVWARIRPICQPYVRRTCPTRLHPTLYAKPRQ